MNTPSTNQLLNLARELRAKCKEHQWDDLRRQIDALIELESREHLIAGLDMIQTAYDCRLEALISKRSDLIDEMDKKLSMLYHDADIQSQPLIVFPKWAIQNALARQCFWAKKSQVEITHNNDSANSALASEPTADQAIAKHSEPKTAPSDRATEESLTYAEYHVFALQTLAQAAQQQASDLSRTLHTLASLKPSPPRPQTSVATPSHTGNASEPHLPPLPSPVSRDTTDQSAWQDIWRDTDPAYNSPTTQTNSPNPPAAPSSPDSTTPVNP